LHLVNPQSEFPPSARQIDINIQQQFAAGSDDRFCENCRSWVKVRSNLPLGGDPLLLRERSKAHFLVIGIHGEVNKNADEIIAKPDRFISPEDNLMHVKRVNPCQLAAT
jgi:hypothetical protein